MRKKLVGAFLASVMLVGGVVGAATAYQTFTATQRPDIKVIMDGKVQDYKDANGNTVYPVIINGTTYLPLRPIANSFGKDVQWNNDTQTITLGEPQPVNLIDVGELEDTYGKVSKVKGEQNLTFDNIGDIGVKYQSAIKINKIYGVLSHFNEATLTLNSSYSKLHCSLLSTKEGRMKIIDEDTGIEILNRQVNANQIVEVKDLDINGVKNLEFTIEVDNYDDGGSAYFLNPVVE